jgi:tetratricopeptide (TPR) repeat protein
VHYGLQLPAELDAPVTVEIKLQYRKFDTPYMEFVAAAGRPGDPPPEPDDPPYVNRLPITTLAVDRVTFPVSGVDLPVTNPPRGVAAWERWNDYGIGLLLEGRRGGAKGELRQAAEAFGQVERFDRYHGPLNLARVYFAEGRLDEAVQAVNRAAAYETAPPWTVAWLTGRINQQQGHMDRAIRNLRSVLEMRTAEMIERKFDFSLDYEVINQLGLALFERAKQYRGPQRREPREQLLRAAVRRFQQTLEIDSENVVAHYNLGQLHERLGEPQRAAEHQRLHARYKPDDNAGDRAIALARKRYPAANHAAEPLVIYPLNRPGAPGLPEAAAAEVDSVE